MRKLLLLVGGAVGYVLGTRAGRERYDQMVDQASRFWGDPRVQDRVDEVKQQAPAVAEKAGNAAKSAGSSVKGKAEGKMGNEEPPSNATGTYNPQEGPDVDTSGFGPGGERLP